MRVYAIIPKGCGLVTAGLGVSDPRGRYLGGYIGFGLGYVVLVSIRSIINLLAGWQASRRIHHASMASLCLAPISFFDTTPIGRILNRFAKVSSCWLLIVARLHLAPHLSVPQSGLNGKQNVLCAAAASCWLDCCSSAVLPLAGSAESPARCSSGLLCCVPFLLPALLACQNHSASL